MATQAATNYESVNGKLERNQEGHKKRAKIGSFEMAERGRFELPVQVDPVRRFSKPLV